MPNFIDFGSSFPSFSGSVLKTNSGDFIGRVDSSNFIRDINGGLIGKIENNNFIVNNLGGFVGKIDPVYKRLLDPNGSTFGIIK